MLGHVGMLWAKFGSMLGDLTGSTLPRKVKNGGTTPRCTKVNLGNHFGFYVVVTLSPHGLVGHIAKKIGFVDHRMGQNPGT